MPGKTKETFSFSALRGFGGDGGNSASDSESDDIIVADPDVLMKMGVAKALEDARNNIKAQRDAEIEARKAARAKAAEPAPTEETEQPRERRQPRGGRGRGGRGGGGREGGGQARPHNVKRNEQYRKGDTDRGAPAEGAQGNDERALKDDNNRPRRNERRQNDRRSANPNTTRRGNEKRGGAGAGNWGEKTENPEDHIIDESKTPDEPEEKADGKVEEQENTEPEVPKIEELTLDEYIKKMELTSDQTTHNLRKVPQLDGGFRSDKIFNDERMQFYSNTRDSGRQAQTITGGFIGRSSRNGFFADGDRGGRGGRGRGRGRGRGAGPARDSGRDNQKQSQGPREFKLDSIVDDFPTLGKK